MAAVLVVPAVDELEDGELGLATSWPNVAVDQLGLEGGKEALGDGIVPTSTGSTDALACLVRRQQVAIGRAGVLDAAIRVLDQAWLWPTTLQRHLQGRRGQLRAEMVGHRPTDDLAAVGVENDGQVQPALP